jgi:hypothetical protein
MIGGMKDILLAALLDECRIIKHLYERLPEGSLDYRPGPGQRSTRELLQYLSFCGIGATRAMVEADWEGYQEVAARAADEGPEDFPAAMDRQMAELQAVLEPLSDEELRSRRATLPSGTETDLATALVNTTLRWLGGYRMQLFLYAKQAGNDDLWTPNCWYGVDMEKPAPA